MRRTLILSAIFLSATLSISGGCSILPTWMGGTPVNTSTDPIVIIEKETQAGVNAIDAFLKVDDENRVYLRTEVPSVHALAEKLRKEAPDAIREVRSLTKAFKASPTANTGDALDKAMSSLRSLADIARKGVQDFGISKAKSSTTPATNPA